MGQVVAQIRAGAHEKNGQAVIPVLFIDQEKPNSLVESVIVVSPNATRDEILQAAVAEHHQMQFAAGIMPPGSAIQVARELAAAGTQFSMPAG